MLSVAPAARTDIIDALEWSMRNFGVRVRECYEALIITALTLISEAQRVPGSREHAALANGLRTLHLRVCRDHVSPAVRRISSPRHLVVYRRVDQTAEVVRILHESMDVTAIRFTD